MARLFHGKHSWCTCQLIVRMFLYKRKALWQGNALRARQVLVQWKFCIQIFFFFSVPLSKFSVTRWRNFWALICFLKKHAGTIFAQRVFSSQGSHELSAALSDFFFFWKYLFLREPQTRNLTGRFLTTFTRNSKPFVVQNALNIYNKSRVICFEKPVSHWFSFSKFTFRTSRASIRNI